MFPRRRKFSNAPNDIHPNRRRAVLTCRNSVPNCYLLPAHVVKLWQLNNCKESRAGIGADDITRCKRRDRWAPGDGSSSDGTQMVEAHIRCRVAAPGDAAAIFGVLAEVAAEIPLLMDTSDRRWPAIHVPIAPKWPPAAMPSETSLAALAKDGRCGIEHLDDVRTWMKGGLQITSIPGTSVGEDSVPL